MKNQFGLYRDIPSGIKRQIRKECGFGCVICGNAVYEYEHISPEFHEAKEHEPANIALLCSSCHAHVTRRVWSKEKVLEARLNPFCLKNKESIFKFDINAKSEYVVKIGNTYFANLESIIEIDDRVILSVKQPESEDAPFRVSAMFFDRGNNLIATIDDNEWHGQADAFDIETKGAKSNHFKVEKMRFLNKEDKSKIIFNSRITIENIPLEAYEYVVNGKSAIEWIMERYQVTVHKESGIKNDPNDWMPDNPSYILDLLLSVITVSVKTVEIVSSLPKITFGDKVP